MKDKITIKSLAKILNINYQTLLTYAKNYTISPYIIHQCSGVWEIYLKDLNHIQLYLEKKKLHKQAEFLENLIKK